MHTHSFIPHPSACRLEDRIEYEWPFGALGNLLGDWLIRPKLTRTFKYRHRITAEAMHVRQQMPPSGGTVSVKR
jgi:ligand-binding SRPBCC domain-containing protein